MKKFNTFIVLSSIICLISFSLIWLLSEKITIIHYLVLSIIPIVANLILYSIFSYFNKTSNVMKDSFKFSIIYAIALFFSTLIFNTANTFNNISENSKVLYADGFSIGTEITFSTMDMILPIVLCFLFVYISGTVVRKMRLNK